MNNNTSSYGAYYNARVANALETNTSVSAKQEFSTNICPRNSTLPTNSQQSSVISYAANYGIVYAGRYYNSSFYGSESYGLWWSRTALSSTKFYGLYASSGSLSSSSREIYLGYAVRCLAK